MDIREFLSTITPFDHLPDNILSDIANQIEVSYVRKDQVILEHGAAINDLYIVRSGAVELHHRDGHLYDRMSSGGIFGQMGLLLNKRVRYPAVAKEDTLLYCLPDSMFFDLCSEYDHFADFVEVDSRQRLRNAVDVNTDSNDFSTSKVKSLLLKEPLKIQANDSIQLAAQLMAKESTSALLVEILPDVASCEAYNAPAYGIVTDWDLTSKALAVGMSHDTPVSQIISEKVVALDQNDYVYEAMLAMLRHNISHLPIIKNDVPIGILADTDIIRYESQNSLLIVNSIFHQNSVNELQEISEQVKHCFVRMIDEDSNSHMIGTAMAVIGKSFKQRLLELAELEFGPPPVPYCFLALGSMARDEQLIVTDQDNALILDNQFEPDKHDVYFSKLAKFVSDGLAACGYRYCSGDIMATNSKWRKTYQQWEACFEEWIENPNPQALLNSSIFFDLEGVWGETQWSINLNKFIRRKASESPRFLACLARNALNRTPPLGFFKNFVMESDGDHKHSINLKRRGTAPIADLIRVHALAIASQSRNSFNRLEDIIDSGMIPAERGHDLKNALEFISMVRIRHQALDIEAGMEPDNSIEPDNLSGFERRNLKDAFKILSNAQNFLKYRYQGNKMNL